MLGNDVQFLSCICNTSLPGTSLPQAKVILKFRNPEILFSNLGR